MKAFSIHSIYKATEGEGVLIGSPQVFVRFQGCAVGCINCDSLETWNFVSGNMSLDEIYEKIKLEGKQDFGEIKRVSITGGDPLHPKNEKNAIELASFLKDKGYFLNIEAAGTRCVDELFDLVDFVSFDYKTPSTKVKFNEKVFKRFIDKYANKSQIKAVIADEEDFLSYLELARKYKSGDNWVITPCYEANEKFPMERFKKVIDLNESYGGVFRVIGQQHKWLHGANKTNI